MAELQLRRWQDLESPIINCIIVTKLKCQSCRTAATVRQCRALLPRLDSVVHSSCESRPVSEFLTSHQCIANVPLPSDQLNPSSFRSHSNSSVSKPNRMNRWRSMHSGDPSASVGNSDIVLSLSMLTCLTGRERRETLVRFLFIRSMIRHFEYVSRSRGLHGRFEK